MKTALIVLSGWILFGGLMSCASTAQPAAAVPAPAAQPATAAKVADFVVLDEPVGPTSGNTLAATLGPVTVVADKDISYTSGDPVGGATVQMVTYLGKKALKVTKNKKREIRVAFVLDKPRTLVGLTTLSFSVAGFVGWDGSYNCGLLYKDAKSSGERVGSFYVGRISDKEWVTVDVDLATDEQWGKSFSPTKEVYALQFWSNATGAFYISDVSLR